MKKKILGTIIFLVIIMSITTTAYALYYPNQFYNDRSWTWEYNAPYTSSYNCLGYATGSMYWEWPWSGNPTASSVAWYLNYKYGYINYSWGYPIQPQIISYGTTSVITHFSKVPTGVSTYCIAKWGSLERFKHNSWNPYNVGSDQWGPYYGLAVETYRK